MKRTSKKKTPKKKTQGSSRTFPKTTVMNKKKYKGIYVRMNITEKDSKAIYETESYILKPYNKKDYRLLIDKFIIWLKEKYPQYLKALIKDITQITESEREKKFP